MLRRLLITAVLALLATGAGGQAPRLIGIRAEPVRTGPNLLPNGSFEDLRNLGISVPYQGEATAAPTMASLSPDRRWAAAGGIDRTVRVWKLE